MGHWRESFDFHSHLSLISPIGIAILNYLESPYQIPSSIVRDQAINQPEEDVEVWIYLDPHNLLNTHVTSHLLDHQPDQYSPFFVLTYHAHHCTEFLMLCLWIGRAAGGGNWRTTQLQVEYQVKTDRNGVIIILVLESCRKLILVSQTVWWLQID